MWTRLTQWLLGLDRVASVDAARPAFGAEWVARGSGLFWLCFALVAVTLATVLFYTKLQSGMGRRQRWLLTVLRALLLGLVLLTLSEPLVHITLSRWQRPQWWVVFDCTASMGLTDRYTAEDCARLSRITGRNFAVAGEGRTDSDQEAVRQDLVTSWLTSGPTSLLAQLSSDGTSQLRFFAFDGQTDSKLRELIVEREERGAIRWQHLADQLHTGGQVTALGSVFRDMPRLGNARSVAGIILVSDFVNNSGEYPLGRSESGNSARPAPIAELGVPLHTIGVGAVHGKDIAIDFQPEPRIRLGESASILLTLHQTEMTGQAVQVRLLATASPTESDATRETVVGERRVELQRAIQTLEIPFQPRVAGDIELRAEVEIVPGELTTANNQTVRRIQVIDDFIRLLYVADEPTWEWRFIKEVFHRDPAVGMRGFHTFLAASDPRVRESNPLFLPTLALSPQEFFAHDVIILDDVPQTVLTPRFCDLVEQFVREFGGGLVVLAGPRFGVGVLDETALEPMLPVILDTQLPINDRREFALQRTPRAAEFSFMQLDNDPRQDQLAWDNLARLPWYQPVASPRERAVVLAQHPLDMCRDGETRQPLIAVRRYGAGEVVYLGFNETWRLRRLYGEKYYRRFWLPIVDRLGLSHVLGPSKRFVLRMNHVELHTDDNAVVTVLAYDDKFQPLDPAALPGEAIEGKLTQINDLGDPVDQKPIQLSAVRPGLFQSQLPQLAAGQYEVTVADPVARVDVRHSLTVSAVTAETRAGLCNESLMSELATQTNGHSCLLQNIESLRGNLQAVPQVETEVHTYALWRTPLWFMLIIALMYGEWLGRKWSNMA